MTPKESSRLNHDLRTSLLPQIDAVRLALEEGRQQDDSDAEWHLRGFLQSLTGIADHFPTSRRIQNLVNRQRTRSRGKRPVIPS